ncbi:MAG: glycosyltransferase 61 family protein [Nocardioides sp.]
MVVLADSVFPGDVHGWLREFSSDDVTVLSVYPVTNLDDVVARLSRLTTQDVILVVLGPAALVSLAQDHGTLFESLFLHLRAGGVYVVDRTVQQREPGDARPCRTAEHFHRMLAAAQGRDVGLGLSRRDIAIARYLKAVLVSEQLVVVTKRGRHALKLREHQVPELLTAREPGMAVSVLEVRPAGQLNIQIEESSYGPGRADPWPTQLEFPEMTLRHYAGTIVSAGGMRLHTGNTILPDSFRWSHAKILRNRRYPSVTPLFSRLDQALPTRILDGDYYFLDCMFSGHFGHLTSEVLCRLWGWDRAKREMPELKALFHTNPARRADGSLERRLFTAYGIAESDLVWSDQPVQLRSVVGASPMWHNKSPYYAHPDIRETWERLTTGLLADTQPAEHERIFVSRGASLSRRRECRNQAEVEHFFAVRGYHVFYPEELPLVEQVRLFAGARVVAGFGGSAMCNLMHAKRLEAVVVISHNAYTARNEHLFTSVLGAHMHYFWQSSDVEPPEVGRSKASDRSSFSFDFATHGHDLARVLSGL